MDGGKIIERVGDYFLQETGSAYEVYSGYAYVVCYQPPPLCGPVQLAGFGRSQLDSAKAFLKGKADADAEGVQFRKRKAAH